MPKMTPSEAMAEVLVNEGVTHVGGIMGSAYMDLLDLFPAAGIDFISVRHEQTWKTHTAVLPVKLVL